MHLHVSRSRATSARIPPDAGFSPGSQPAQQAATPRFGRDFTQVPVYRDTYAAASAEATWAPTSPSTGEGPSMKTHEPHGRRPGLEIPEGEQALPVPPIVDAVLRTPGQPLDAANRASFESRFGQDLSRVRVHNDPAAALSTRTVNAS